jgi:hypothetical protein
LVADGRQGYRPARASLANNAIKKTAVSMSTMVAPLAALVQ